MSDHLVKERKEAVDIVSDHGIVVASFKFN